MAFPVWKLSISLLVTVNWLLVTFPVVSLSAPNSELVSTELFCQIVYDTDALDLRSAVNSPLFHTRELHPNGQILIGVCLLIEYINMDISPCAYIHQAVVIKASDRIRIFELDPVSYHGVKS